MAEHSVECEEARIRYYNALTADLLFSPAMGNARIKREREEAGAAWDTAMRACPADAFAKDKK